jgi:hypothetical protein
MRCFYLDPGLRGDLGHHANFCRYISGALRRRGIETAVFGHIGMSPALCQEFGAQPHFRTHSYQDSDGDPISGWLSGFDLFARVTAEDLTRLPPVEASDLVYLSTGRPIQLMALLLWYRGLPEAQRPWVVVEVNETGMAGRREGSSLQFELPDPRTEPRPLLFRFIAQRHLHPIPAKLRFITFDQTTSSAFGLLMNSSVQTAPLPYRAVTPLRNRAGAAPITVACLGHQRDIKGYPMLPEISRRLLQRHSRIRILIQTVTTGLADSIEATAALQDLASIEPRLELDHQPAGAERWPALLERADLMLCPYQPEHYAASFSSMACEALANAIPAIVPAGTTLASLLQDCGGAGEAFAAWDPSSVLAAAETVLRQFDFYAERAYRAAVDWPAQRGPERLADHLVEVAAGSHAS